MMKFHFFYTPMKFDLFMYVNVHLTSLVGFLFGKSA